VIIQATVLESALLVDSIVNDPVPREATKGIPSLADGRTLVSWIRLPGSAQGWRRWLFRR
jgi:hypothetical protein